MIYSLSSGQNRFLIASIVPRSLTKEEAFLNIKELRDLVDSYEGQVVEYVIQNREVHDKGLYLGSGKIDEIAQCIKQKSINIVVLNAIVKPGHIFDIKQTLEKANPHIEVWDRVDLILHIFSRHANTSEARLQIELAAMRHMGPRIYGLGYVLSRQGGSIGTKGIGETNTELMRRHWRNQMKKTQDKLSKLTRDHELQLARRRRVGLHTVSIVGYTNAGKTSLFNLLTKKKQYVKNELFATLDSHVGKLISTQTTQQIIISDTIGFIHNLPTKLIDAFRSTLMESVYADLLIHVVDATDPDLKRKIETVSAILNDLNIANKSQILVFNKIDLIDKSALESLMNDFSKNHPILISVKDKAGITTLTQSIELFFSNGNLLQI